MAEANPESIQELGRSNKVSPLKKILITKELRKKIDKFKENLIKSNVPYDTLCWALAEFELIFEKGHKNYSEHEVIEREKKIFNQSIDYKELCWFIANLKVYLEQIGLYP